MPGDTAVMTVNAEGGSPFVLVCDHASNRLPDKYGDMGLPAEALVSHIAWDPGAMALCEAMSAILDAPVVASTVSRLVIDCNRDLEAPDLVWTLSEATPITANEHLEVEERAYRIAHFHKPFHDAIDALLDRRSGRDTVLVCMHSFTPVYLGIARPWQIGVIHGRDPAFTAHLRDTVADLAPDLDIGWNQPYAAQDGVTLTLERHGDTRGLPATMIEVRNNEIADDASVSRWAGLLSEALIAAYGRYSKLLSRLAETGHA
ncbi:N-formylglutamate amidohydrolase [Pelagibacterium limicola]|uniref:N-formylglutamate amidohydrolase n=1 Tax=Pelagibacterium limicola TaxID=2791022 RepID=UPI0018AF7B5A